jgi:hypothetical protein
MLLPCLLNELDIASLNETDLESESDNKDTKTSADVSE